MADLVRGHLLGLGPGIFEGTDVHESTFGERIAFAFADALERVDRRIKGRVDTFEAGELLGDVEGLGKEPLQPAGAANGEFVRFAELIDANHENHRADHREPAAADEVFEVQGLLVREFA